MYDKMCLEVFLDEQEKLFEQPVAETENDARAFLEDCMAEVFSSLDDVREYFEDTMDICDLSDEELEAQLEVFRLPDGRYLVVEG